MFGMALVQDDLRNSGPYIAHSPRYSPLDCYVIRSASMVTEPGLESPTYADADCSSVESNIPHLSVDA